MDRFYVCVKDGVVLTKPIKISQSESESPNVNWGREQMVLNGFYEADVKHDSEVEGIDLDHPMIAGDVVTYPRIRKTNAKILSDKKEKALFKLYWEAIGKAYEICPEANFMALGFFRNELAIQKVGAVESEYNRLKEVIQNATSITELEVKPEWPS